MVVLNTDSPLNWRIFTRLHFVVVTVTPKHGGILFLHDLTKLPIPNPQFVIFVIFLQITLVIFKISLNTIFE